MRVSRLAAARYGRAAAGWADWLNRGGRLHSARNVGLRARKMAMRIAIHQPHFLPWLGYLHRMASVDAFVLLDHVQFERRNYQNRTGIRMNGAQHWLTVPVVQRSQQERIVDKEVDNGDGGERWWGKLCARTLQHVYGKAPFY